MFGIQSCFEYFLSQGANLNEKSECENIALHNAACNYNKETAELVISHGTNVNKKNKYGMMSLHIAACCNKKL
ncbi:ankyrin repeat protein, putative [Trichomonas vaginalis G3]|uniref:Ankyrin repeat protein, putative n=1 Tax=Trichomonas vaginalis (strain ATCC PRA-98 / G3) TaxID=412133 RepID=A2FWJ4_TRIV3|nr:Ankyrin repeat family [Trichomonas vaginalis G3]EAX90733.1 ankyrin repeat protein, putative [Trichomonas vaginalis G3]KAI5507432.1 Ankyrin repeat family [Trichomonas vaginalis G3]|eukprot:XP_001303663.1 ankyrin repeat protein [Trichomonas vaginalis G3]